MLGSLYCARAAVRRMSTRYGGQGGGIVNLTSIVTEEGGNGANPGVFDGIVQASGQVREGRFPCNAAFGVSPACTESI